MTPAAKMERHIAELERAGLHGAATELRDLAAQFERLRTEHRALLEHIDLYGQMVLDAQQEAREAQRRAETLQAVFDRQAGGAAGVSQ